MNLKTSDTKSRSKSENNQFAESTDTGYCFVQNTLPEKWLSAANFAEESKNLG
jgi:hypothetical protein